MSSSARIPTRCVSPSGFNIDMKLAFFDHDLVGHIEKLEDARIRILGVLYHLFENVVRDRFHVDLRIQPQAEGTKEDRRDDLSLAETGVKDSLLVVFKLDPRTAVRNDLRQIFVAVALKKNARRTVKLRNDHALRSVDDERTVVGHQRNFAKENIFFLDIADRRNVVSRDLCHKRSGGS